MSGITFDAGGLIALDRNDRRVLALVARARERGLRITIPATALAQAIRNPARQARLSRIIRQVDTDLIALDGPDAYWATSVFYSPEKSPRSWHWMYDGQATRGTKV